MAAGGSFANGRFQRAPPSVARGFAAPAARVVSRGGFVGPRRIYTPPRPAPIVRAVPPGVRIQPGAQPPGREFIPYYDPSRIITDIKVVKDLRQSGTERGETQTGDSGTLGPGGGIAPPSVGTPGAPGATGAPGENNLIPIALGIAAFILLGG